MILRVSNLILVEINTFRIMDCILHYELRQYHVFSKAIKICYIKILNKYHSSSHDLIWFSISISLLINSRCIFFVTVSPKICSKCIALIVKYNEYIQLITKIFILFHLTLIVEPNNSGFLTIISLWVG